MLWSRAHWTEYVIWVSVDKTAAGTNQTTQNRGRYQLAEAKAAATLPAKNYFNTGLHI